MIEEIYIMWLRQMRRYFRARERMIGSLGQPILFLLAFGFGFSGIFQRAGEGDYIQFLSPGIIAMSVFFVSMFSGVEIIWDRRFGFLKEILASPVTRMEIMAGRSLGGATTATLQGLFVLIVSLFIGFKPNLLSLPLAVLFMVLMSLLFTSVGTAIASTMEDMQAFQIIMNFFIMPLFFLSGAIYPLDSVPEAMRLVALMDPLSYGVDGLRGALTGAYHFNPALDLAVLAVSSAVFLIIGSKLFSRIQI